MVPPLRQRPEDVIPLAKEFAAFFGNKYRGRALRLSTEAEYALQHHDWPGNVRELQNALERAVILCDGEDIDEADLPFQVEPGQVPEFHAGGLVTLGELEEAHIRRIVASADTLEEAAQILGIDPATLWRRRKSTAFSRVSGALVRGMLFLCSLRELGLTPPCSLQGHSSSDVR